MDLDTKHCLQKDLYHHELKIQMFEPSLLGTRTARNRPEITQHPADTKSVGNTHASSITHTHMPTMLLCWKLQGVLRCSVQRDPSAGW